MAYNLTEALVRLGHDVTLFAAGGTRSSAKVVTAVPHALSTWLEAERCRTTEFDPDTGHLTWRSCASRLNGSSAPIA